MSDGGTPGRRGSEVLDAIWEQVEAKPERSDSASLLFRAKALDQLDVAAEIDNQLPLVSRRSWLLLVGVALLVGAFLLWAALTPSVSSISAPGRMVAQSGTTPVVATVPGILVATSVATGDTVEAGDPVATLRTETGDVAVRTVAGGTVWQLLAAEGSAVAAGAPVVTLLPPGSDRTALLAIPEGQAAAIRSGMTVTVGSTAQVAGTVESTQPPLPAVEAAARTGLALTPGEAYVLVSVALPTPLPPGEDVAATVVLSDATVMQRLLGRS